ncbi:MFS transporter [Xaviernesmea oryzae]|uniref:MFS transporter n=1 Tax=Xaviernesmea oryzae TaxID=464029 RepID=A0A1Q9AUB5_9HYPH|nr:MFS transporter [Xaviernesmea oryzae]OLP58944.1 MFS transporter [Xaviernesmea oryzae]SEM00926.1 Sugar phosphate permease [Xaviernesmea oryzae]
MNIFSLSSATAQTAVAPHELNAIYRKIVVRIVPILMVLWVLAWIDRVNVSFAKLQMMDELRFSEAVYGLGAGIFYIGYLIFEVPSNLLLQKIGARRTIARIAIGWGLVCILMSQVTTPIIFYGLRFLLGAFEAGFFPGVILYLTHWFPSDRRAKVFGIFMSSVALSGVIGGPMAGTVMSGFHDLHGLAGWQWLFIVEGVPTMLIGVFALFYLTDRLEDAHWLTPAERATVAADLTRDQEGLGPREYDLQALLRDPRLWVLTAIYFGIIVANATVAFWGPTIVRDAGVADVVTIGWIVSGASLLGSFAMIFNGFAADKTGRPLQLCNASLLVAATAFVVVAFSVDATGSLTITAFALALAGAYGAIPVFWQIPNRLFAGTAAAAGIAIINSIGNLGGFLAPYGLGMLKTYTGDVTEGLLAVASIALLAALALATVIRRFFGSGSP